MKERKLVDRKQAFGEVKNERPNGGEGRPKEHLNKPLSNKTEIHNRGTNHGPSFADKNPGALDQACAHSDNPFIFAHINHKGW